MLRQQRRTKIPGSSLTESTSYFPGGYWLSDIHGCGIVPPRSWPPHSQIPVKERVVCIEAATTNVILYLNIFYLWH